MKSYTDLEQSEKLAGILPITTIDFAWNIFSDGSTRLLRMDDWEVFENAKSDVEIVPCWSLAALLGVLPIVYTNNKKEICGPLHIDITDSENPFALWYVNPLHKGSIVELKTNEYDNLLDACVEMILKLKENNILL